VDSPQDYRPDEDAADAPPMPKQAELEALFDAGEAEFAAGRTVASAPVLARMRLTAERIRRERAAENGKADLRG
jgi:hypothetical protein